MNGKKWFLCFLAFSLAALLLLAALCAVVDPFMRYRVRDNEYFLSTRFVTPGLIRNYDYDTVVLGSSFTQNFLMDSFREKLCASPLKVTLGGMTTTEISQMHDLIKQVGKAKTVYLCIPDFLSGDGGVSNYPDYLVSDSRLSEYRYLLGYEAWLRYIPTDLALLALDALGVSLPEKFTQVRSIDYLDYWADDTPCGNGCVQAAYERVTPAPYDGALASACTAAACARIDAFLIDMGFDDSIKYVLFFPPYSALHYTEMSQTDVEAYLESKVYLIEALSAHSNITVYDFQSMELITDLENYCDPNHFGAHVNEIMIDCFASGRCRVTADTVRAGNETLLMLAEQFRLENADWL